MSVTSNEYSQSHSAHKATITDAIQSDKPWGIEGKDSVKYFPYNETFKGVLEQLGFDSIESFLKSREAGQRRVLDLMAPLDSFIDTLDDIDEGVAISLKDHRDEETKEKHNEKTLVQLSGDVIDPELWKDITEKDLIICRPEGGLGDSGTFVQFKIFLNALKKLSPNRGLFITNFSHISNKRMKSFVDFVSSVKEDLQDDFEISTQGDTVAIQRISESTDSLLRVTSKLKNYFRDLTKADESERTTALHTFIID